MTEIYYDHPDIKTGWAEAMDRCIIDLQQIGADIKLGLVNVYQQRDDELALEDPVRRFIRSYPIQFAGLESDMTWQLNEIEKERQDILAELDYEEHIIVEDILGELEDAGYIIPDDADNWSLSEAMYYQNHADEYLDMIGASWDKDELDAFNDFFGNCLEAYKTKKEDEL